MTPSASNQQQFNDGQIQFGCIVATLKYSASPGSTAAASYALIRGTYVFEDFTPSRPTKRIQQRDEIGGPRGQVLVTEFSEASAVVQWNDSTQAPPQVGDVFTAIVNSVIGTEYWVVGSLSEPKKQEDYWKSNLTCHKVINPNTIPNFTPQ